MADPTAALAEVRARLLAKQHADGSWRGELSASALATAVAVCALRTAAPAEATRIARGDAWLRANANADGGWGDTPDSPSNLPTTLLAWAALEPPPPAALAWLDRRLGGRDPQRVAQAVAATYGDDLTFTAPLLALLAAMGRLGPEPACWKLVAQLPCELLALPHRVRPWLRLGVVSYGLPALVAIGLLRHRRAGDGSAPRRWLRDRLLPRALGGVAAMWPGETSEDGLLTGGFNEAPPLVGFVALGLAGAGLADHALTRRCVRYLGDWQRADGSWSVEADLRGWLTSLAVAALAGSGGLPADRAAGARAWLLAAQRRTVDPVTRAAAGGWAWTSLPGAMPDGDDTAGALLALRTLDDGSPELRRAATTGARWLAGIQNADGGIPTFCRGWGRLPFDRSCPDLTAHAWRAWRAWDAQGGAAKRAARHLRAAQRADGAWLPLWFGNQSAPGQASPVYGTAQALRAFDADDPAAIRGAGWLASAQGADGGWGGDLGVAPSIEETALAVAALAGGPQHAAAARGAGWLADRIAGGPLPAAPIGLYFAQLWYAQRLYPLIWTVQALGRMGNAE